MDCAPSQSVAAVCDASYARGAVLRLAVMLLVFAYGFLALQTAHHDDKDWSHLWLAGRMVVTGHAAQLYDPGFQEAVYRQADAQGNPPAVWGGRYELLGCFNYPPPAALWYALFAWLPLPVSAVINAWVTLALALAAAWLLARSIGPPVTWPLVSLLVLLYPPFFINLSLGQNAVLTLCVLAGAWHLAARRRDLLAGMVLALLLCKPNWLFAVGWIPLVYGRWRVLLGMATGGIALVAGTGLVLGGQPFLDYATQFQKVAQLHELPGYSLNVKYNGLSVFRKWLGTGAVASLLGWCSCLLVILATRLVGRLKWRPDQSHNFHVLVATAVLAALWVNPHLNYYDLVVVLPCVVVLIGDWPRFSPRTRIAAVALLLLMYAAVPWDEAWAWRRLLPVPSIALLLMWAWFLWRIRQADDLSVPPTAPFPA